MQTILNLIWFFLSGFWLAASYVIAGIVACLLIVTFPAGVACFRIASYALWPFGRTIIRDPGLSPVSTISNVIWLVFFGWWIALCHLISAAVLAVTIIGIPLAAANLRMIPISLRPFGAIVISS